MKASQFFSAILSVVWGFSINKLTQTYKQRNFRTGNVKFIRMLCCFIMSWAAHVVQSIFTFTSFHLRARSIKPTIYLAYLPLFVHAHLLSVMFWMSTWAIQLPVFALCITSTYYSTSYHKNIQDCLWTTHYEWVPPIHGRTTQ